jgi:hypothetical protein
MRTHLPDVRPQQSRVEAVGRQAHMIRGVSETATTLGGLSEGIIRARPSSRGEDGTPGRRWSWSGPPRNWVLVGAHTLQRPDCQTPCERRRYRWWRRLSRHARSPLIGDDPYLPLGSFRGVLGWSANADWSHQQHPQMNSQHERGSRGYPERVRQRLNVGPEPPPALQP